MSTPPTATTQPTMIFCGREEAERGKKLMHARASTADKHGTDLNSDLCWYKSPLFSDFSPRSDSGPQYCLGLVSSTSMTCHG